MPSIPWVSRPSARQTGVGETRRLQTFRPRPRMARLDLKSHSWPTPVHGWAIQGADSHAEFRHMPVADSRQLVEQRLRFFQIGGVEALGEPAINRGEQIAGLGAPALVAPQPREACRGTQFK
jgi:hypothetical protein